MLRIASVAELTGLSKSTIYVLEGAGNFPKRIPLTSNTSAWSEAEVQDWIAGRKNDRDRALRARGRCVAMKT
ncbi:AlpA family phage regulatory protein [Gammaproteobacteria bacterium]|nr:AlpA family phage regulatory protein [Gammaproteobacteria bacterium]